MTYPARVVSLSPIPLRRASRRDRGSNFTASFDAVFQSAGTMILRTAVQAPRMKEYIRESIGVALQEIQRRKATSLYQI
jgi:hypothetical protein